MNTWQRKSAPADLRPQQIQKMISNSIQNNQPPTRYSLQPMQSKRTTNIITIHILFRLRRERYGEPNSTGSSTGSQGSNCGNQTGSDRGTETRTTNETSESSNSNRKTKSRNSEKHHRDRSNNGRGSRSELKEIHEEPESEDDDFDIEASPRQNRLKVYF